VLESKNVVFCMNYGHFGGFLAFFRLCRCEIFFFVGILVICCCCMYCRVLFVIGSIVAFESVWWCRFWWKSGYFT
jgi:hypothetical protein